ncbi:TNT domain-containing protein [Streptomyces sp. bgisy100]|uniref:TNT domain-containing protein n=1 Tax=Streptomyces sp. bgisy100 TaxID=3413783 RepID=UPI003D707CDA
MRSFRWGASLVAAAGLAGSLLLGSAVSSAAPSTAGSSVGMAAAAQPGAPAGEAAEEHGKPNPKPKPKPKRKQGHGQSSKQHRPGAHHQSAPQQSRQPQRGERPHTLPAPVRPGQSDRPGRPGATRPDMRPICLGLVPPPYAYADRSQYFCGDWRLGPTRLPTRGVLGNILGGYQRFGHLTPVEFLNKWWDPTLDSGQGDWKYPPEDGFQLDSEGNPIAAPLVLHAGTKVDRFGNEAGRFLSPAGTRYGERALPPSSLDTTDPRYPFNYHLYRVTRDLTVCAGPIAPAFEQPGNGTQYVTSSNFCPTVTGHTVGELVRNGTLARIN